MANHKQLVEEQIGILQEIISRLSGGLTKALADKQASENAEKLIESHRRMNDLIVYYNTLYALSNAESPA